MAIAFYNTLTRKIEPFISLEENQVGIYACGPTVYNYFHIGNARSFVMADVIRRYFQYRGYEVKFVMNITDVDDKIIRQANEEGVDSSVVARKYADAFLEDISRFGICPADAYPRPTENMTVIIEHIDNLVAEGIAYVIDGDVFFSVEKFPEYGKLSGKKLEELLIGARVEADLRKRNPIDFALWKKAKPGEPAWDSPWGKGRPGWHIECSVMSQKYLGQTFDIHAGGNDLIFPHHENEIAQSEALSGQPLARYWIHFGFLNIDNEKMSKSLGNFFTAREILDKYPAETIRFFYLQTHYRGPLNFNQEGLDAADKGLQKLQCLLESLETAHDGARELDVESYEKRFIDAVDQDFNTPAGFGVLFELVRDVNTALHDDTGISASSKQSVREFFLRTAGDVFGVLSKKTIESATDEDFRKLMGILIATRTKARQEKQWILSDFIRDELRSIGISLEDGKTGTIWKKIK